MIIAKSPLRITLGGGGTDLPSYYNRYGGFVISAAIDQYVYVTVNRPFTPGFILKYSKLEHVQDIESIQHPIVKEALRLVGTPPQIEITALADIPSGTGLGSSGSFTTALLKALFAFNRRTVAPNELAELACHIEIDCLSEPVGKQDQYIAAYGGVTCFTFCPSRKVAVEPLKLPAEVLHRLEDDVLLFFTGYSRSAGSILKDQKIRTEEVDPDMLQNLHYVKELGLRSKAALETGQVGQFGEIMHEHWEHKKRRSNGMSNPQIDEWYEYARQNGAIGGKLVGAGGGGFLMFCAEDQRRLRGAMAKAGLGEVRFRFDFDGCRTVCQS
jgi:D-glycero-alpha-D-manno-heptose-7-phosphate kinase